MQFETELGGRKLIVKTGEVAGQANGSCIVQYGETSVLATAVMGEEKQDVGYFPLTIDYEERFYAAGKIKGSRFIKRETRPPDEAILAGRLIDRSLRPLFDQSSRRPVQVILTVLSIDQENDPDIVSLYAAVVALIISDIPWDGPVAGVRVGQIDGEWALNPTYLARSKSDLDLVVCGKDNRALMIEAGAKGADNKIVYEAIQFGVKHIEMINKFFQEIQTKIGKTKVPLVKDYTQEEVLAAAEVKKLTEEIVKKAVAEYLFVRPIKTKEDRIGTVEKICNHLEEVLVEKNIGKEKRIKAVEYAHELIYCAVSRAILDKSQRIDGRKLDEIRQLSCTVGVLPRVHGSALFSRGETQVLSVITLGAPSMEQYLDTMEESGRKRFMHHYNFPPFCSGETGPLRATGRRETGHGALAEKGLSAIIPDKEIFPHTIRLVSEVLSSNGSTSMAATCASLLALMDGGVPIKEMVSGVAIGLASEEDDKSIKRYKIITDLQDLEDGPGGMDFKIIGTESKITAIQMDTKTRGLTFDIIKEALDASVKGRAQILETMKKVLDKPRPELSQYAPSIEIIKINPEKIRDVIGPGGRIINEIIKQTGSAIDVEQDGTVAITSTSKESLIKAVEWIKNLTREVKVGEIFQGTVSRIMDFGAFVEILPGQEGMVHVSELAPHRVEHPDDVVKVGQSVKVKVFEIDKQGRINLTMKGAEIDGYQPAPRPPRAGPSRRGGFGDRRRSFHDR